eukprot:jgi/Psemu1/290026/fgenesh1_pg.439_\
MSFEQLFAQAPDLVLWLDTESIARCFLVCKWWSFDIRKNPKAWTKQLFSIAEDLVLWLDAESTTRCFLVCKSWRSKMQKHPRIWTNLLVSRFPIFTCHQGGQQFLEATMPRAKFFLIVGSLVRVRRISPVVFHIPSNSPATYFPHNLIGLFLDLYGSNDYRDFFRINGFREIREDSTSVYYELGNPCVFLHAMMQINFHFIHDRKKAFIPKDYCIYFDKCSMTAINTDKVTYGWSGDEQRQYSTIERVIRDFVAHGYTVKKNTPSEIIFQKYCSLIR